MLSRQNPALRSRRHRHSAHSSGQSQGPQTGSNPLGHRDFQLDVCGIELSPLDDRLRQPSRRERSFGFSQAINDDAGDLSRRSSVNWPGSLRRDFTDVDVRFEQDKDRVQVLDRLLKIADEPLMLLQLPVQLGAFAD